MECQLQPSRLCSTSRVIIVKGQRHRHPRGWRECGLQRDFIFPTQHLAREQRRWQGAELIQVCEPICA